MSSQWNEGDTLATNPKPKDDGSGGGAGGGGTSVDARERHKLAERERRKSMRELFLSLHALLPHAATIRKEQSAILDEIIKYIPIAAARLRSLQKQKEAAAQAEAQLPATTSTSSSSSGYPALKVTSCLEGSGDCSIRVMPEPSSAVSIRVRGDRVNVSLTDTKSNSHTILLSSLLDELEAHNLELLRSTHCKDGSKLLHHSESKICGGLDRSPALLRERLQELACKLLDLKKSSSLKRSFDQID